MQELLSIPLLTLKGFLAFSINEKLIIFRIDNESLHILSEASSWLFLSLDAGHSEVSLKKELLENQIDSQQFDNIWQELNQIMREPASYSSYRNEYELLISSARGGLYSGEPVVSLLLLEKRFHIHTSCLVLKAYLLGLPSLSGRSKDNSKGRSDFQIFIKSVAGNYLFFCNGELIAELSDYRLLMPRLMDYLQIIAYQSSDYLLSVHSAMMVYKRQGIMFPGQSGSGKSTLCASLISEGFICYSDEVATISIVDNSLSPIPLPMAIKTGSWRVLKDHFPEMEASPVWQREDGRCSKYVELPQSHSDLPSVQVKCIVFPQYEENAACLLTPVDSVSALKYLTQAGYQIKERLTADKVKQILDWIVKTPAYNLRYSNLEQAHAVIKKLMDKNDYC